MPRRGPDELTDREHEVLALLRRDFTNEQIAQRLGISLAGAKYHVSQILSKRGVATSEKAAAATVAEAFGPALSLVGPLGGLGARLSAAARWLDMSLNGL